MRLQKAAVLSVLVMALFFIGCGEKTAGLEGRVVDALGKPAAEVRVTARMEKPLKGYDRFAAVTDSSGTFNMSGMYPHSRYALTFASDKWATGTKVTAETGPGGETALVPEPIVIAAARARSGALVFDLSTGATRFSVSEKRVIADSKTGLEWVVGPDADTAYGDAVAWVADCATAGGGFRMPTLKELGSLYQKAAGERNMDPVFRTTGWAVWAGPKDQSSAFAFDFLEGKDDWGGHGNSYYRRVFGVRPVSGH